MRKKTETDRKPSEDTPKKKGGRRRKVEPVAESQAAPTAAGGTGDGGVAAEASTTVVEQPGKRRYGSLLNLAPEAVPVSSAEWRPPDLYVNELGATFRPLTVEAVTQEFHYVDRDGINPGGRFACLGKPDCPGCAAGLKVQERVMLPVYRPSQQQVYLFQFNQPKAGVKPRPDTLAAAVHQTLRRLDDPRAALHVKSVVRGKHTYHQCRPFQMPQGLGNDGLVAEALAWWKKNIETIEVVPVLTREQILETYPSLAEALAMGAPADVEGMDGSLVPVEGAEDDPDA